jgi:hypothetical protein
MNAPVTIQDVTYSSPPESTTPPGDINPTLTKPGLNFPTDQNPTINVKLDQPTNVTLIYVPVDRPGQPTNVYQFDVAFQYPNGTTSPQYTSTPAGQTTTTTTPAGLPSSTSTTPATTAVGVQPPSAISPQVDLPPNFSVPSGTVVQITVILTSDDQTPTGVRIILALLIFVISLKYFIDVLQKVRVKGKM